MADILIVTNFDQVITMDTNGNVIDTYTDGSLLLGEVRRVGNEVIVYAVL